MDHWILPREDNREIWRWYWTLGFVVLAAGCGQHYPTEYGEVSGKVIYNNEPVRGGRLTYVTVEGGFSNSVTIDENGNFKVKAPVGDVKFAVDNRTVGEEKFPGPILRRPDSPPAQHIKGTYAPIPKKYYTTRTSPLTYTVTKGPQTFDLVLKGQPSGGTDRPPKDFRGRGRN
jgi:hypothetical protein